MTTKYQRASIVKPDYVRVPSSCHRCGGAGGFKGWPGFRCFRCGGCGADPEGDRVFAYPTGWTEEQCDEHAAKREAKRAAAAVKREAKRAAEVDQQWLANVDRFPVLAEAKDAYRAGLNIGAASDVLHKAERYALSEAQARWVADALARAVERAAEAAVEAQRAVPVPTGRVRIEGTVKATKWQESQYGSTLKMLVACDGFKVWGSVPSALSVEAGDRVAFTATVEASGDDPSFGFFKRPTNALVIEPVAA